MVTVRRVAYIVNKGVEVGFDDAPSAKIAPNRP
jgi:hypothetical protein